MMERSERCDNFMKCIDAFIKSVQDKPGRWDACAAKNSQIV